MSVLESLTEPSASVSNEHIEKWRANGGDVVAYFCSYIPEELIHAAGLLPVRIRATGSMETEDGDTYLSNFNCSFARHVLDLVFKGGFDFADGIVGMNSCDHIRRLYDIIDQKAPRPFMQFLYVPHLRDESAQDWYLKEISEFRKNLEQHFGVEITDEKLSDSIRLFNDTRRLLRAIHETRRRPNPPISGSEMLGITVSATAMPKEELNRMLRELVEELDSRPGIEDHRARMMLVAGLLDDPEFLKVIEEQGALIVTESLCFGTRYFWNEADESLPPMEALAERYMNHQPCPRMIDDQGARFEFIKQMAEEYEADGIICERLKFCDLWAGESAMLRNSAREADIPLLMLDKEYTLSGVGQVKTRVQAFVESMNK
jgi:bzd-type benzoyl-CoA reductase N subunit